MVPMETKNVTLFLLPFGSTLFLWRNESQEDLWGLQLQLQNSKDCQWEKYKKVQFLELVLIQIAKNFVRHCKLSRKVYAEICVNFSEMHHDKHAMDHDCKQCFWENTKGRKIRWLNMDYGSKFTYTFQESVVILRNFKGFWSKICSCLLTLFFPSSFLFAFLFFLSGFFRFLLPQTGPNFRVVKKVREPKKYLVLIAGYAAKSRQPWPGKFVKVYRGLFATLSAVTLRDCCSRSQLKGVPNHSIP